MSGITAIGAYIPMYRLSRKVFAQSWGTGGGAGERSVASYDEDSLTMAVEAGLDLLKSHGAREEVDALYFASTTAPYGEKSAGTLAATAIDLGSGVRTMDFGGTIRSGTSALLAALDAVNAGSVRNVLVVAADDRWGYPRSVMEATFGNAGAALMVSAGDAAVEVVAQVSLANEINDVWRTSSNRFVTTWEDRFVIQHGYDGTTKKAIHAVLEKAGLKPADVAKAIVYAPDARNHTALIKGAGFDAQSQAQDNLIATVGNAGAAHVLLMLVAALEEVEAGQKLLVAGYGEGADALVLEVKHKPPKARAVSGHLAMKRVLDSYEKYAGYRGIVQTEPAAPLRVEPYAASTITWRDQSFTLRLHGSKCNQCGTVAHPIQRVCYTCQSKDDYREVRLSDKPGTIYNFTRDHLAGGLEPPVLNTVVESDEGKCRVYAIATDAEASEAVIDTRVEFTFRKMHELRDAHHYYWKVRPIRDA